MVRPIISTTQSSMTTSIRPEGNQNQTTPRITTITNSHENIETSSSSFNYLCASVAGTLGGSGTGVGLGLGLNLGTGAIIGTGMIGGFFGTGLAIMLCAVNSYCKRNYNSHEGSSQDLESNLHEGAVRPFRIPRMLLYDNKSFSLGEEHFPSNYPIPSHSEQSVTLEDDYPKPDYPTSEQSSFLEEEWAEQSITLDDNYPKPDYPTSEKSTFLGEEWSEQSIILEDGWPE